MRELAAAIEQRTQLVCSIGIGPNKLVAKVASDAEKPRGFVVLSSRAGARPLPRCAPGADPRDRAQDGGAAARGRLDHARGARRRRSGRARAAVRAAARPGADRPCPLRGRRAGHPGAQGRLRIAGDDVRPGHRGPVRARGGARLAGGEALRATSRLKRQARDARSASRSASTTSRPTPAPARSSSRWRVPSGSARSRWSCCDGLPHRGRCGCWGSASPGSSTAPRQPARHGEQLALAV